MIGEVAFLQLGASVIGLFSILSRKVVRALSNPEKWKTALSTVGEDPSDPSIDASQSSEEKDKTKPKGKHFIIKCSVRCGSNKDRKKIKVHRGLSL
jgi:hypothetical protein